MGDTQDSFGFLSTDGDVVQVDNRTPEEKEKERTRKIFVQALWGEFMITLLFMFSACAQTLNAVKTRAPVNPVISGISCGFAAVGLIYSFADVSGAHFNPAVTFSTFVGGKTTFVRAIMYIGAQLAGVLAAMALLASVFPAQLDVAGDGNLVSIMKILVVVPSNDVSAINYMVMEITLTFIFVYVIFAVAFDTVEQNPQAVQVGDGEEEEDDAEEHKAVVGQEISQKAHAKGMTIYTTSGNSKSGFAPIAIGLTLGMLTFLGGSVSGGAFNPARVFGPALLAGEWTYVWMYWACDLAGGALAAMVQIYFSHQRVYGHDASGLLGLLLRMNRKTVRAVKKVVVAPNQGQSLAANAAPMGESEIEVAPARK